jgi:hypothetical protein
MGIDFFPDSEYIGKQNLFPMDINGPTTKPLSSGDKAVLQKLKEKAWLTLLKLYVPLFLMLVYVYYKMEPGGTFRGRPVKYTMAEFKTVFPFFAAFFGAVFLFFVIKDFRRLVLPFFREALNDTKYCQSFLSRKYLDPIYNKCLLFYPDRENFYIEVCPEDFDSIGNGEDLYLEVASVTGEVLYLKSGDRVFKEPAEFSFSDR